MPPPTRTRSTRTRAASDCRAPGRSSVCAATRKPKPRNWSKFSKLASERTLHWADPKHHKTHVGSELKQEKPRKWRKFKPVGCIQYVATVLDYSFDELDWERLQQVWKKRANGVDLVKLLSQSLGWPVVYWNADVNHPIADKADQAGIVREYLTVRDENVYRTILKKGTHKDIKVAKSVVNFDPTDKNHKHYLRYPSKGLKKDPTVKTTLTLKELARAKFGVGLTRGGFHTFLFSEGNVYEVHWRQTAASGNLYEKTDLATWATRGPNYWTSGVIAVPPGSKY